MLKNCATSCDRVAAEASKDADEVARFNTFFDLTSRDIHGKEIKFQDFEGKVTLVVNVASECGYTDSHYTSLTRLFKEVPQDKVNILAFPCNQFGAQEPGTPQEILGFVQDEYGVEFTMMEKVKVNGPDADIVYKWLKSRAGPSRISWNFATYYVIGPEGQVEAFSGVEPYVLKDKLLSLLSGDSEL
jgi:glutathione peroxidase